MRLLNACWMLTCFALPVLAAPAPSDRPKWEYAELQIRNVRMAPDGDDGPRSTLVVRWTAGDDEVEVKSLAELAEKLKLAAIKKEASANAQRLQLMNLLGAEGWELMSISSSTTGFAGAGTTGPTGGRGPAANATLLFKRRVP